MLATRLIEVSEQEYPRFNAHWLTHATDIDVPPERTGSDVIDALVAAAAHVGFTSE